MKGLRWKEIPKDKCDLVFESSNFFPMMNPSLEVREKCSNICLTCDFVFNYTITVILNLITLTFFSAEFQKIHRVLL